MKFLAFQKLGENRGTPRVWIESRRLNAIGFSPGIGFSIESRPNGVRFRPAVLAENHVSQRISCKQVRPIIDIASREALASLTDFSEIKIHGSLHQIDVTPSTRAFYIHRRLRTNLPFKTLEVFSGGGTLSAAIAANKDFALVAGIEMEPKYADVWQQAHPNAMLYQTDIRLLHPGDLPPHDVLVAAIPCTSHSSLGRAKKSLAGKPELGDCGDLYLGICEFIAHRLPLACVFENVPSFGSSLAGQSLSHHLRKLGYHIEQTVVDPHNEWNEPQDRRRWIMVATLKPGFQIISPRTPFTGTASLFLDAASESDRAEVERITGSIEALRRHNERHSKLGHGFGFTTINRESKKIPTIVRSYHKINTGPFVETEHGLRLLHKEEVERLMGCKIDCGHYATAIEILGQGVQTRVFRIILEQLGEFLKS
ncbi:MAG TPA: DNA cytosine methyltransferase [Verrucomicrobiae bacterium]|nr:DNA cytosine methyltransferase [Verrucomicrobiae bacterium]